jgi:hypothetical protein
MASTSSRSSFTRGLFKKALGPLSPRQGLGSYLVITGDYFVISLRSQNIGNELRCIRTHDPGFASPPAQRWQSSP